jgi:hypothetical protein
VPFPFDTFEEYMRSRRLNRSFDLTSRVEEVARVASEAASVPAVASAAAPALAAAAAAATTTTPVHSVSISRAEASPSPPPPSHSGRDARSRSFSRFTNERALTTDALPEGPAPPSPVQSLVLEDEIVRQRRLAEIRAQQLKQSRPRKGSVTFFPDAGPASAGERPLSPPPPPPADAKQQQQQQQQQQKPPSALEPVGPSDRALFAQRRASGSGPGSGRAAVEVQMRPRRSHAAKGGEGAE